MLQKILLGLLAFMVLDYLLVRLHVDDRICLAAGAVFAILVVLFVPTL